MFKVGETVRLKSGGPLMTVEKSRADVDGKPMAWVTWFKGEDVQRAHFPIDTLEKDDGDPVMPEFEG